MDVDYVRGGHFLTVAVHRLLCVRPMTGGLSKSTHNNPNVGCPICALYFCCQFFLLLWTDLNEEHC